MAEMIFKDLVYKNNKRYMFNCKSRATSIEEIGNGIYPKAKDKLEQNGILVENHRATRLTKEDYINSDLIIVMETKNIDDIKQIIGINEQNKIHKLLEYTDCCKDIDDPWYTDDFDIAYDEIKRGCDGLFKYLVEKGWKDGE